MDAKKLVAKVTGEKRRWREYKRRVRKLPADYAAAVTALERYILNFGPEDGDSAATLFEDLIDLFEQAVADGTSIRGVVGEDPVEFAEAFLANYTKGGWATRQRNRLIAAIDSAEAQQSGTAER
jgi:DNA-binding ferritin-like protein (Dps family)